MILKCSKCGKRFVSDTAGLFCSPQCAGEMVEDDCIFLTRKGCTALEAGSRCKGCTFKTTPVDQRRSEMNAMNIADKHGVEWKRVIKRRW